ncbi:MAG TPA: radical SAM protein [Kiritimatiellia bacterium]|nr:radical SAM protein [Kiritimatiellia bacterium]
MNEAPSTVPPPVNFPTSISFTLTNLCNLRCKMCGQWSEEGYMHDRKGVPAGMQLADWKRLVDEIVVHGGSSVLMRGGETFLYPHIVELLDYAVGRGLFVALDTNGTQLKKYAADIVRLGKLHLTVSIDGPEEIHDEVRGVKGCFRSVKEGLARLRECEQQAGTEISKAICFVISPYSVRGLGAMPNVARSLGIKTIAIVPYYYVTEAVGRGYESVLRGQLGCPAFSWHGFHHEASGVDFDEFIAQFRKYTTELKGIVSYPYMAFSEEEYRTWFTDPVARVGPARCMNVERLLDVQPSGDVNFCVDFPDYVIGNARDSTLEQLWNSERAARFRDYRRGQPLPVCHRCGAKYMSGA